jgi:hypothetical protein
MAAGTPPAKCDGHGASVSWRSELDFECRLNVDVSKELKPYIRGDAERGAESGGFRKAEDLA